MAVGLAFVWLARRLHWLTYWSGGEVFIVRKLQIKQSATVFVALHL